MNKILRFLKYSFMIGGGISAIAMFNSADTPFDLKHLTGDLAVRENTLKESLASIDKENALQAQRKLTQEYIRKSQKSRVQKAIVKYREVDYVFINGKYYPYNPKNIYNVDGVKTLFIPGGYDELRTQRANARIKSLETQYNLSNSHLVEKSQELLENPLEGYSPRGIRKMQETLFEIKKSAEARNRFMESL
jgi:hypothetical protein